MTQMDSELTDVDLANGEFVEFVGKSSSSLSSSAAAAAAGGGGASGAGVDRWSGFEYTPVHLSYRYDAYLRSIYSEPKIIDNFYCTPPSFLPFPSPPSPFFFPSLF